MDDLSAMLSQILSDPNAMQQIGAMASSLGLTGTGGNTAPQLPAPQNQANSGGGADLSALAALLGNQTQAQPQPAPDLSALASLLGSLGGQQQPAQPAQASPDLSAIASLLGNIGGGQPAQQQATPDLSSLLGSLGAKPANNTGTKPDLSALTALLNGGNPPASTPQGLLPNIDLSTIMKISQAMSSLQGSKANVDLLLALKPRLKEERAKKVDDAIRVMQLIQFLPLIKESGLFGEMDNILGGLGNLVGGQSGGGLGGLGGLLGNVGNGIGGLLGNLGLAGGRR